MKFELSVAGAEIHLLSLSHVGVVSIAVRRPRTHRIAEYTRRDHVLSISAGALAAAGLSTLCGADAAHGAVRAVTISVWSGGRIRARKPALARRIESTVDGDDGTMPLTTLSHWEKNEGKNLARELVKGGLRAFDTLYDSRAKLDRISPLADSEDNNPGEPPAPSDIRPVSIIEEMQRSYLDYAMSVIVARALPDVRDGLKPVHRRILYAMHESGYRLEQQIS